MLLLNLTSSSPCPPSLWWQTGLVQRVSTPHVVWEHCQLRATVSSELLCIQNYGFQVTQTLGILALHTCQQGLVVRNVRTRVFSYFPLVPPPPEPTQAAVLLASLSTASSSFATRGHSVIHGLSAGLSAWPPESQVCPAKSRALSNQAAQRAPGKLPYQPAACSFPSRVLVISGN